jgi:hypothetical protein
MSDPIVFPVTCNPAKPGPGSQVEVTISGLPSDAVSISLRGDMADLSSLGDIATSKDQNGATIAVAKIQIRPDYPSFFGFPVEVSKNGSKDVIGAFEFMVYEFHH